MNNYFCVLPFFSYEIENSSQKNIHCCRLAPGTDIESVRTSILNGERNTACTACWNLEDQGLTSERILHNQAYDYHADHDIELVEQAVHRGEFSHKIIKIATSNLCNGTCVTCGPTHSTAWAQLRGQRIHYQKQTVPPDIDLSSIAMLSFVGGEPLLESANFDLLEKLLALGNDQCFVSITTNGSVELTEYKKDILSRFKNLNICLSIDGVGPVFEYLRYPLKWSDLEQNLEFFKTHARWVSVSAMISNLNISYYDELVDFFEQHQLKYLCKQITDPDCFSPGNLPKTAKTVIASASRRTAEVESFLNMGTYTPTKFEQCWNNIEFQDRLKKISIADFLLKFTPYRNLR